MTQARKLKKRIRARAGKTGERYTAARHQLLESRAAQRPSTPPSADVSLPESLLKGEARLVARTGHVWAHWFAVLDAYRATTKSHAAAARHVAEVHGVDDWYAQKITVGYERARGLREANQRMSGDYEVSVSKVLPAPVLEVVAALRDRRRRADWASALESLPRESLEAALTGKNRLVERDRGGARMRFRTSSGSVIELRVDPKPKQKSSVVVQTMKLKTKDDVARCRAAWKTALEALRLHLAG